MFAVNATRTSFVKKDRHLVNMEGKEIHLVKGQRVILVSAHCMDYHFFGIQGKEMGLIPMSPEVFGNNFNNFEV